jgi:hypothetical protein
MNDSVPTLDLLHWKLRDDPALRARLFEIADAGEFLASVARLAEEFGRSIDVEEIRQAMRQSRRDWFERNGP